MTLCHIGFMGTTTVQVVGTTDANLVLREAVELAQEGYHLEYLVHGVLHRLWEGAPEDQAACTAWVAYGALFQRKLNVLLEHAPAMTLIVSAGGKPIKKFNYTRKSF
jgi:hypothetical protein